MLEEKLEKLRIHASPNWNFYRKVCATEPSQIYNERKQLKRSKNPWKYQNGSQIK